MVVLHHLPAQAIVELKKVVVSVLFRSHRGLQLRGTCI